MQTHLSKSGTPTMGGVDFDGDRHFHAAVISVNHFVWIDTAERLRLWRYRLEPMTGAKWCSKTRACGRAKSIYNPLLVLMAALYLDVQHFGKFQHARAGTCLSTGCGRVRQLAAPTTPSPFMKKSSYRWASSVCGPGVPGHCRLRCREPDRRPGWAGHHAGGDDLASSLSVFAYVTGGSVCSNAVSHPSSGQVADLWPPWRGADWPFVVQHPPAQGLRGRCWGCWRWSAALGTIAVIVPPGNRAGASWVEHLCGGGASVMLQVTWFEHQTFGQGRRLAKWPRCTIILASKLEEQSRCPVSWIIRHAAEMPLVGLQR
jgi:hypothetical protein